MFELLQQIVCGTTEEAKAVLLVYEYTAPNLGLIHVGVHDTCADVIV
jgi:hypothetical protein